MLIISIETTVTPKPSQWTASSCTLDSTDTARSCSSPSLTTPLSGIQNEKRRKREKEEREKTGEGGTEREERGILLFLTVNRYQRLPEYLHRSWDATSTSGHVYFVTYEQNAKVYRVAKEDFCHVSCPYNGYSPPLLSLPPLPLSTSSPPC